MLCEVGNSKRHGGPVRVHCIALGRAELPRQIDSQAAVAVSSTMFYLSYRRVRECDFHMVVIYCMQVVMNTTHIIRAKQDTVVAEVMGMV